MNESKPKKVVGRSVAIALGIICIILVASLGVVLLLIQVQNQFSSLEALKTEIEAPNVSILTYSWQDSPYLHSTTQNLLIFNCTLLNTGLRQAQEVHVNLTVHYEDNTKDSWSIGGVDIPARQTAMLTVMDIIHNNTAIRYITLETDWLGGSSGNIVDTYY